MFGTASQNKRWSKIDSFVAQMSKLNSRINSQVSVEAKDRLRGAAIDIGRFDGFVSVAVPSNLNLAKFEELLSGAERAVSSIESVLRAEAAAGRLDADILSQLGFSPAGSWHKYKNYAYIGGGLLGLGLLYKLLRK